MFLGGLFLFFSIHGFAALFRGARGAVIARLGEGPYKGVYTLIAAAGLTLIVFGWPRADTSLLYAPPYVLRHATNLLMLFAMILLVAAYAPAGRIAAAVKHPMLAGVKTWALAHLLANGEVRSVLLFGAFLVFAVVDRIAVKRRGAPVRAAGPLKNDVIVVIIGVALYAAVVFYLHRFIAGVPIVF